MSAGLDGSAGVIVGNQYDKYGTRNPVARWLMDRFLAEVVALARHEAPRNALEVGCGEGKLAHHLVRAGVCSNQFTATDCSLERVDDMVDRRIYFAEASAYELPYADGHFDLVLCCEVLEHLERPATAMAELARVARLGVVVSTPREPLWRVLNMARGHYLDALGNTPGHIQHFSSAELVALAARELHVVTVRKPIPWTIVRGRPRLGDR